MLRAYITVVGSDMSAQENLMRLGEYNSIRYYNLAMHKDSEIDISIVYKPHQQMPKNHSSYNFYKFLLQEHNLSQKQATYIQRTGDKVAIAQIGFQNYTILWKLSSLIFP